ncbi:hypothetical protein CDL15_Pgr026888 [Punica granatum]|uniref:Uncharacterized protein n=1 Tax=Punica granatum TaxID=22663 RepID=A0A218WLS4_PUNGR|nr:hypothetical protein CDL15_Pgr026888 [Punica granatum]
MERVVILMMASLMLMLALTSFPLPSIAVSSCNGPCTTLDDCGGQLICINGRCTDDPEVGTHICTNSLPSLSAWSCQPSGTMYCEVDGNSYLKYQCSPPVTSSTRATLTNNDFREGWDGGDPSKCDDTYHSNSEHVVALSTGWCAEGSHCG